MARRALDPRTVARVVAAYGFDALRGRSGSGSGAAPAHRLAELRLDGVDDDKRTVAKKVAGGIPPGAPPASTATPFDFAFAALFDWSTNGGQASFEASLELMGESIVPLDPEQIVPGIASLLRLTVQHEFEDPEARFLTGHAVQALALDHIRESEYRRHTRVDDPPGHGDESLAWASWLIERRRQETRATTQAYEAVLALGLLRLRRRPRQSYTVGRIVRAVQSLWTGGMLRAFLLPEEYPEYGRGAPPPPLSPHTGLPEGDGQIEQAMVDLIIAMTEESLFSVNQERLEHRLVVAGLQLYRGAAEPVTLDAAIAATGADERFTQAHFPSDRHFASACVRWLAGDWEGFEPFTWLFRASAMAGVEALLEWVASVRKEYPALWRSAGFERGDPEFDEVVAFVASVVHRASHDRETAVCPGDLRLARRGVEAAAAGDDWRTIVGVVPSRRSAGGAARHRGAHVTGSG